MNATERAKRIKEIVDALHTIKNARVSALPDDTGDNLIIARNHLRAIVARLGE